MTVKPTLYCLAGLGVTLIVFWIIQLISPLAYQWLTDIVFWFVIASGLYIVYRLIRTDHRGQTTR